MGACLPPFLNLIKSFSQTRVENGSNLSLVLMGLLKHVSFSQNRTLVLPQISIFAPCTVLFVSYSSVFASHSPVVHPTLVFCIPLLLLQSCLCHTSVIDFHAPGKHLICFCQVTSDNLCLFKGRHSLWKSTNCMEMRRTKDGQKQSTHIDFVTKTIQLGKSYKMSVYTEENLQTKTKLTTNYTFGEQILTTLSN